MVSWQWNLVRTGVVLALVVAGSEADSSSTTSSSGFSNSITSTSSIISSSLTITASVTNTITSGPTPSAAIASCGGPVNIVNYFNPDIFNLPADEILPFVSSELFSLDEFLQTYDRIKAVPLSLITNTAAYVSYSSSVSIQLDSIVSAIFGANGYAIVFTFPLLDQPCLFSTCISEFYVQSSSFQAASPSALFDPLAYVAQPPCCLQCTIFGQGVQLSYWPTPAPQPPVSTLINGADYTFVSPSVYAVFTGLSAVNLCGTIGPTIALTTLSFGPSELSTSSIPSNAALAAGQSVGNWTAINYANFGPQCICTANCSVDPILGTLTNLCTPQLSIPTEVSAIDPAWSACGTDFGGVFDPPIVLVLADGLTTPKSTPALPTPETSEPSPSSAPSAVPLNSPTPASPSPTSTPEAASPSPPPVIASLPPPANPSQAAASPATSVLVVIVGGSSGTPVSLAAVPVATTPLPALTINGQTIASNSQGAFVIGTQTLIPGGPAITVSGTPISLAPSATAIVVGGTTTPLGSVTIPIFTNNGGAATGTATAPTPAYHTGEASRGAELLIERSVFIALLLSAFMVWL